MNLKTCYCCCWRITFSDPINLIIFFAIDYIQVVCVCVPVSVRNKMTNDKLIITVILHKLRLNKYIIYLKYCSFLHNEMIPQMDLLNNKWNIEVLNIFTPIQNTTYSSMENQWAVIIVLSTDWVKLGLFMGSIIYLMVRIFQFKNWKTDWIGQGKKLVYIHSMAPNFILLFYSIPWNVSSIYLYFFVILIRNRLEMLYYVFAILLKQVFINSNFESYHFRDCPYILEFSFSCKGIPHANTFLKFGCYCNQKHRWCL